MDSGDKPIALFDMDNTLFDYEGQLTRDFKKLMAPGEEFVGIWDDDDSKPYIKARTELIKRVPGWWRDLPIYQPGWDIFHEADMLGFENHILTKGPKSKAHAWGEKVECITNHFGDSINIDVVMKDKSGRYGRVLVDDYPPYVLGWLQWRPRGLAIMPAHSYNKDICHPNIIRYTGDNMAEVKAALKAVKDREPGVHWKTGSVETYNCILRSQIPDDLISDDEMLSRDYDYVMRLEDVVKRVSEARDELDRFIKLRSEGDVDKVEEVAEYLEDHKRILKFMHENKIQIIINMDEEED